MFLTIRFAIISLFILYCFVHQNSALQCKACQKNEAFCLLGQDVPTRRCPSDNDLCFSWFDRTGSHVGVQRGCMSMEMPEYDMIMQMINQKKSGCMKRTNGLDCFSFCSTDSCN